MCASMNPGQTMLRAEPNCAFPRGDPSPTSTIRPASIANQPSSGRRAGSISNKPCTLMHQAYRGLFKRQQFPIIGGPTLHAAMSPAAPTMNQPTAPVFDKGLANTVAAETEMSFIDGEKGILEYVGIEIDALARNSTFEE